MGVLIKRALNHFEVRKTACIVSKRGSQSRIFFFYHDVSRNIPVQTHELWYSEGKCWLSHLLYDMLENINYLGEREVFLLFYSKSQIISNIYLNGTWFLPCVMWLLLFALWNISTQRSLDGANHSLVHFQPSQIKPPFFLTKSHILWSTFP